MFLNTHVSTSDDFHKPTSQVFSGCRARLVQASPLVEVGLGEENFRGCDGPGVEVVVMPVNHSDDLAVIDFPTVYGAFSCESPRFQWVSLIFQIDKYLSRLVSSSVFLPSRPLVSCTGLLKNQL